VVGPRAADRPDAERPSPHQPRSDHPREFVGEIFIGGSNKATVLRAVTEDYLPPLRLDIKLDHGWPNMAMAYPWLPPPRVGADARLCEESAAVVRVSRPLEGEAPTIDLAVGYSKANSSPILKLSFQA